MSRVIRILQVVRDVKFWGASKKVAQNQFIQSETVTINPNHQFVKKFIENGIKILKTKSDLVKEIQIGDYDVIFFHSLPIPFYDIVNKIPPDLIVIWFSYGFDIYGDKYEHGLFGLPAFIEKILYRPKTRDMIKEKTIKQLVKEMIGKLYYYPQWKLRNDVIKRIDYLQPVRPLDFCMMQNVKGFRAKEIYLSNCGRKIEEKEFVRHDPNGSIILGNSASPIINHLDVWNDVKKSVPCERPIIMPLSYGNLNYAERVKKELSESSYSFQFLDTFMPRNEYFNIMNSCSYALYGSIRQHAMGNIYYALSNDIKVFLYRGSLMYSYLIEMGFVVYAIEEINSSSFTTPITYKEHNQNIAAFEKEYNYCYNKGQDMLKEITQLVSNRKE